MADLHDRHSVHQLTEANWVSSRRVRRSCNILMPAWIEATDDGRYRGTYGFPDKGFGVEKVFDLLGEALEWANHDGSGMMLYVGDT
jgi:hypothetical protein